MYVKLDLFNIHSGKEMKLKLPTRYLESHLRDYCTVEELNQQVLSLEMESDFDLEDNEFINIPLLNETLIKIQELSSRDFFKLFQIWRVQEDKNLYTLVNLLKYYDNYEIIDRKCTDRKTIANLVNLALFGCSSTLIWELPDQLTPNNVNALISVGLKSGIIKAVDDKFYIYDNTVLEQNVIDNVEVLEQLPFDRKAR